MYFEQGGSGNDLLLMLHGAGATGAIWQPFIDEGIEALNCRWVRVDLPGHGYSQRLSQYGVGQTAAAVAEAALPFLRDGRVTVLGHSLGGVIALALASHWFAIRPTWVFGVGIKVSWSDEDLQRVASISTKPPKTFSTEAEALERYLKVSGLATIAHFPPAAHARGIVRAAEGWRLTMDPLANASGKPPLAQLLRVAQCPVHLARGGNDPLVTLEETQTLDASASDLGSYGHNAMVEAPRVLLEWLQRTL